MSEGRWAAVLATVLAARVRACPVCDSERGRRVQAGILGDDFLGTAAAVLLTFPVIVGIVALIHFGLPGRPTVRHAPPPGAGP